jgi:hypothetical protein
LTTTFRRLDFELGDWDYVQEHLPGFLYVEDVRGIVAIRDGKIGGMIFFDNWTVTACNAHQIVTTPEILIEGFLEEAWGWVFSPTGGKRIVVLGIYAGDATAASLTAKRVGFQEVYRIVDGCRLGVDRVTAEMRKENCRYV